MDKLLYILWWFMFNKMDVDQRMQISPERMAYMCGLEEDEFEYFAQVVEAESDGRVEYHDGKYLQVGLVNRQVVVEQNIDVNRPVGIFTI